MKSKARKALLASAIAAALALPAGTALPQEASAATGLRAGMVKPASVRHIERNLSKRGAITAYDAL